MISSHVAQGTPRRTVALALAAIGLAVAMVVVASLGPTASESGGATPSPVIQTRAAINPGNSGGAPADLRGRVVGIPTFAALDPDLGDGPASGVGFAIPRAMVEPIASGRIAARGR